MVREASRRQSKFEAKVDADVLRTQTLALKPLMVAGQSLYFPNIVAVESKVKNLVETEGVSSLEVRDYINFGRELYRLTSKFSQQTLLAEAKAKLDKWSVRGLSGLRLTRIARLFGLELEGFEVVTCVLDFLMTPQYIYDPSITSNTFSAFSTGADIFRCSRFPLTRKARFDRIGYYRRNLGGLGKTARLGVYDSGKGIGAFSGEEIEVNRYPRNLKVQTDPLDVNAIGWVEQEIDLTLEKGLYYLAINTDSPNASITHSVYMLRMLGASNHPALSPTALAGFVISQEYGSLPSVFPTLADATPYNLLIALRLKELF